MFLKKKKITGNLAVGSETRSRATFIFHSITLVLATTERRDRHTVLLLKGELPEAQRGTQFSFLKGELPEAQRGDPVFPSEKL